MNQNFEQILVPQLLKDIERPYNILLKYPGSVPDEVFKLTKKIDSVSAKIADYHQIKLNQAEGETESLIDAVVTEINSLQANRRKKKLVRLLNLIQVLGERKKSLLECLNKRLETMTDLVYGRPPGDNITEDWREQL
jgi:hypothetical protein